MDPGLINDIKRKAPHYLSDFTDGFSMQCIATYFFIYFACLTPIVTFGGLLGDATENRYRQPWTRQVKFFIVLLCLSDYNKKRANMSNRTMEYGWRQNIDYVGGALVDPPTEYITPVNVP